MSVEVEWEPTHQCLLFGSGSVELWASFGFRIELRTGKNGGLLIRQGIIKLVRKESVARR